MLVLLPDHNDGLRDLEKTLSTRMVHECLARMGFREVELLLPRFKTTWGGVNLRDQLTALGMPLAFSRSRADFSGINGHKPPDEESLFISAVFHKAFVEVNEDGTEAAAATVLGVKLTAALTPAKPRQFLSFEQTIPSCSPSAIERAVQSCSSGAWPIRRGILDVGLRARE